MSNQVQIVSSNKSQESQLEILKAENINLKLQVEAQNKVIADLKGELAWFKREIFGKKSERSFLKEEVSATQLSFLEKDEAAESPKDKETTVGPYKRKARGKTKPLGDNESSGIRFGEGVEIVEESVLPEEAKELSEDEYEIVGEEISDMIASKESKHFIHRRRYLKIKLKNKKKEPPFESASTNKILQAPVTGKIHPGSYLSLSFIAEMLLSKCIYSEPLYRQNQRLKNEGVYLSRSTLSKNFIRYSKMLSLIVEAQLSSILLSRVLAIDETPYRVGVDKQKHQMKKGWVWPILGDSLEVVFIYNQSRGAKVLESIIKGYKGTLISDGYSAYKSYISKLVKEGFSEQITHAVCWVHARRKFVALGESSKYYKETIEYFKELYQIESEVQKEKYSNELEYRLELGKIRKLKSLDVVNAYFKWLKSFQGKGVLATNENLRKAINYSLNREESMRVFLNSPEVPLDTNNIEREIKQFAVGRKNYLFSWSEVGAEALCNAHSLTRTCIMQGINPKAYLIDVLQKVHERKPKDKDDVYDLIPSIWKDEHQSQALKCVSLSTLESSKLS